MKKPCHLEVPRGHMLHTDRKTSHDREEQGTGGRNDEILFCSSIYKTQFF